MPPRAALPTRQASLLSPARRSEALQSFCLVLALARKQAAARIPPSCSAFSPLCPRRAHAVSRAAVKRACRNYPVPLLSAWPTVLACLTPAASTPAPARQHQSPQCFASHRRHHHPPRPVATTTPTPSSPPRRPPQALRPTAPGSLRQRPLVRRQA